MVFLFLLLLFTLILLINFNMKYPRSIQPIDLITIILLLINLALKLNHFINNVRLLWIINNSLMNIANFLNHIHTTTMALLPRLMPPFVTINYIFRVFYTQWSLWVIPSIKEFIFGDICLIILFLLFNLRNRLHIDLEWFIQNWLNIVLNSLKEFISFLCLHFITLSRSVTNTLILKYRGTGFIFINVFSFCLNVHGRSKRPFVIHVFYAIFIGI